MNSSHSRKMLRLPCHIDRLIDKFFAVSKRVWCQVANTLAGHSGKISAYYGEFDFVHVATQR
jgi:hypothetical protein